MWLYIYLGNTPKIQAILEKWWGRGGKGETNGEREGRLSPPTYHRCFCKPFDPQGSERKSGFIIRLNDSVCDLFLYSQRTGHLYIFYPSGRCCPFLKFWDKFWLRIQDPWRYSLFLDWELVGWPCPLLPSWDGLQRLYHTLTPWRDWSPHPHPRFSLLPITSVGCNFFVVTSNITR